MSHPQDFDVTRVTSRRTDSNSSLPDLSVPTSALSPGLYRNEIVINSYEENPAIYLRVGSGVKELDTDSLVRLGKIIVTDDLESVTEPTVLFDSELITWTGEGWLRTTDNAYFVHDGTEFVRITPVTATTTTRGLVELATDQEVIDGVNLTNAVTPSSLLNWRNELEILSARQEGNQIYVDQIIGDDSLYNYGVDIYKPFLTIERALLEVARQSFIVGLNNDIYQGFTIVVNPGDYTINNRPGSTDYTSLPRQSIAAVAPSAVTHTSAVTAVTPVDSKRLSLSVTGLYTAGLRVNQQVWNTDGSSGVVSSINDTVIVIRNVKGLWETGDSILYADYSVFNSTVGGVIVPRGVSIVSLDPRKTIIRPRYLGDFAAWEASISGCNCNYIGGTARFKLTGGCKLSGLTFADSLEIKETHHLVTSIEFASLADLTDSAYGYYRKVYQVLGNTVDPAMVLTEYQMNQLENAIVSGAANNTATDSDGYVQINTVAGSSPWVHCCSLLSRFGARAMRVDGNLVAGLKSMITDTYTSVSLQVDQRAYTPSPNAPGGVLYKPEWAHPSFEALNDGYLQAVSSFSIAAAVGYRVKSGGELSLTNCHVNFGETAFVAEGRSLTVLPQDTGFTSLSIVPPKPIGDTTQNMPLGAFKAVGSSSSKLYCYDELDERRISPFSIVGGETLYLTTPSNVTYTADIVDTAPFFEEDNDGWYINVKPTGNGIHAQKVIDSASVDSYFIYIERTPDLRQQPDRIYWLQIEGVNVAGKRPPQLNYVFQIISDDYTLDRTLFVADVRSSDTFGNALGAGIYQIALMSAEGLNDSPNSLYPSLNIDTPVENSQISKTYIALNHLLEALGVTELNRATVLSVSEDPVSIVSGSSPVETTLTVEFYKPSTVRAFGTGLEWVGYGNYSSALPKYQQVVFDIPTYFTKLKREEYGGRVYNTGMNQDGQLITGDRILDLRTGDELSLNTPFADSSQVLKNLTITSRLNMYPNSVLGLGGAKISIDSNTEFSINIQPSFKTYATQDRAGLVELSTTAESNALSDLTKAVTPGTLPVGSSTQVGLLKLANDTERDAMLNDTTAITPADFKALYDALRAEEVEAERLAKIGEVKFVAHSAALEPGWLHFIGQEVSRTTYSELFAKMGTTWGEGNGTTTFNLPSADRVLYLAGVSVTGTTGGNNTVTPTTSTKTGLSATNNSAGITLGNNTTGILIRSEDQTTIAETTVTNGTGPGTETLADVPHGHAVYDPGHGHTLTDSGHTHAVEDHNHTVEVDVRQPFAVFKGLIFTGVY